MGVMADAENSSAHKDPFAGQGPLCLVSTVLGQSDHSVFQLNDSLDSIPLTESPHGEDALITKRKATAGRVFAWLEMT